MSESKAYNELVEGRSALINAVLRMEQACNELQFELANEISDTVFDATEGRVHLVNTDGMDGDY